MVVTQKLLPKCNLLVVVLLILIIAVAVLGALLSFFYPNLISVFLGPAYVPGGLIYDAIYVVLSIAANTLYLIGGGVIVFGALFVTVRFIQIKLKDPYRPSSSTHYLSGYLTLSLNFFIGAEIIRTVATRTMAEFELLLLVIFSRGLFSLILYLERRWHGTAEIE
jgi:uncharacterized membrane protein